MTVSEVEKFRYWVDEYGQIWERRSYCLQPTVTFEKMRTGTHQEEPQELGGAIGCLNVQGLKPIEHPYLEKAAERERL